MEVLKAMKLNPTAMQEAFVDSRAPLDAATVENVFLKINWSLPESNRFKAEKRIITYWRDFLQDCNSKY